MPKFIMRLVKEVEVEIEAETYDDAEEELRAMDAEGALGLSLDIELIAVHKE